MDDVVFLANVRYYLAVIAPLFVGIIGIIVVKRERAEVRRAMKASLFIFLSFVVSVAAAFLMFKQLEAQVMQTGPPLSLVFTGMYRALLPLASAVIASLAVGTLLLSKPQSAAAKA